MSGSSRRGMSMMVEMFIMVIIGLTILALYIVFASRFGNNFSNDLKNFGSCSGIIGTLGGGDQGAYCSPSPDCKSVGATADKAGLKSVYWQSIGQGWGCPSNNDQPNNTYCCISVPTSQNPIDIQKIKEASCQNTPAGTIVLLRSGACQADNVKSTMDDVFNIRYYTPPGAKDGTCKVKVDLSTRTSSLAIIDINTRCISSNPYIEFMNDRDTLYDWIKLANPNTDLSAYNEGTTMLVTFTRDGKTEATKPFTIGPPSKSACPSTSDADCRGHFEGDIIRKDLQGTGGFGTVYKPCVMTNGVCKLGPASTVSGTPLASYCANIVHADPADTSDACHYMQGTPCYIPVKGVYYRCDPTSKPNTCLQAEISEFGTMERCQLSPQGGG